MACNRFGLAAIVAALIVASTGFVHGRWTGRWASRHDDAGNRNIMDFIPREIGDWRGEDQDPNLPDLRRAGIERALFRTYRNTRTGDSLNLLVVGGAPGPISVHTPDVCYQGAGYEMVGAVSKSLRQPGFSYATFERSGALPETLHIYWSWFAQKQWQSPQSPRLKFALESQIYKIYIVRRSRIGEDSESGIADKFLEEAIQAMKPDSQHVGSSIASQVKR